VWLTGRQLAWGGPITCPTDSQYGSLSAHAQAFFQDAHTVSCYIQLRAALVLQTHSHSPGKHGMQLSDVLHGHDCGPVNTHELRGIEFLLQRMNGEIHAAGDMTSNGGATYTYNGESQMVSAGGYTYLYDGDGNRVAKTNGSTGTLYWYGAPGVVLETDLLGNPQSEYIFFGGSRIARRDVSGISSPVYYYFANQIHSTALITDANGNIEDDADYYPWGGTLQFSGNLANHYWLTSKERDPESGLDYLGARYYGNSSGRFTQPDVPGVDQYRVDPQSWNLYTYVRNNPPNLTDPTGMYVCADSKKCDSANDQAFAANLASAQQAANALKDQFGAQSQEYTDAQRAIDAYGKQGVDNGVTVQFVNGFQAPGMTYVSGVAGAKTADNPTGQNVLVKFNAEAINSPQSGPMVAHEGSHVADAHDWVKSGFSPGKDSTRYQTEIRPYRMQFALQQVTNAAGYSFLNTWVPPGEPWKDFRPVIQHILQTSPMYGFDYKDVVPAFKKGAVLPK